MPLTLKIKLYGGDTMKIIVEITGTKNKHCGECRFLEISSWSNEEHECMLFSHGAEFGLELKSDDTGALRCNKCTRAESDALPLVKSKDKKPLKEKSKSKK